MQNDKKMLDDGNNMDKLVNLGDLTKQELEEFVENLGQPKYRGRQIFKWVQKGAESFDGMTDQNKALRSLLKDRAKIYLPEIAEKFVSKIDGTIKYLLKLEDGNYIESVVMRYKHGNTICISSQVGCRMGCKFCASTIGGLVRNLSCHEMAGQIIRASKDMGERISNIVIMGIGEPLDNYENILKFFKIVNDPDGLNIGLRHITLSTCGLVDRIYRLADEKLPITLAISLHAANDGLRKTIMPIANKYSIDELIKACFYYVKATNRRITFEYALISGVNDDIKDAIELSNLLDGLLCHVNLIPVNPINEADFKASSKERIEKFVKYLESNNIPVTVRRKLGSDIDASCGQLRKRREEVNS